MRHDYIPLDANLVFQSHGDIIIIIVSIIIIIIFQILHILTKNLQSPGFISFGMPGNQPIKICPKVN